MRFSATTILLSLFAIAPVINARSTHHARTTLDVCAHIQDDLAGEFIIDFFLLSSLTRYSILFLVRLNPLLGIMIPDIFGSVNVCLCVSGLAQFIQTNTVTSLATTLKGSNAVIAALTTLVRYSLPVSCVLDDCR